MHCMSYYVIIEYRYCNTRMLICVFRPDDLMIGHHANEVTLEHVGK